jgi:hypothetical protein
MAKYRAEAGPLALALEVRHDMVAQFIVLQTKYQEWSGKRELRRMIVNISLYFLLPGTMSLLAMLAIQATAIWRIAFVVTSVLGAVESAFMVRRLQQRERSYWVTILLRTIELVLFALIAVVGLFPDLFRVARLTPLTVAGVLLTLIVVGGIALMWTYLIAPVDASDPSATSAERL